MDRAEAIDILVGVIETHSEEENEALDLAIEALKEPTGDYEFYGGEYAKDIKDIVERIKQETDKNPDSLWSKGMHSFDGMEEVLANRGDAESATTTDCNDCIWNTCNYNKIDWEFSEDCISRKQAVEVIHNHFADEIDKTPHEIGEDGDAVYTDMKAVDELLKHNKHISKAIKELPPVTPTERTGEWIDQSNGGAIVSAWYESHKCNKCGSYGSKAWDFCPNCGAKMGGDSE